MPARRLSRLLATALLALLLPLTWTGAASAHRVVLYAWAESGTIHGEGYFSGGGRAVNAPVEVLDAQGQSIASARTDDQGRFALPVPNAQPPLKLILKAGEGHLAEFTLTAADLGAQPGPQAPAPSGQPASQAVELPAQPLEQVVEQAVRQALDKRLEPLTTQLAQQSAQIARMAEAAEKPGVREIVGGLGWIVGMAGLYAWLTARRQNGRDRG